VPNRLANQTSPYLLQHAHNPVDWYPWAPEALDRARAEDRPILLSIGYSACHWCHVMERESFENHEIAALMNGLFVNIKVDREERPDLDTIYMAAVQTMTGHGGWPMTVFLTPECVPFYGGTYFPPADRGGMPGFPRVLQAVADAYRSRRADVARTGTEVMERLDRQMAPAAGVLLTPLMLDQAARGLIGAFDPREGGLNGAPKFPQPMALELLLREFARTGNQAALDTVELTLTKMALGGIYDQLGGGFHRYSVDGVWLVPHFEKMLYDNALLTRVYTQAFQITGKPLHRRIVEETLAYVEREMTDPSGGFYSTQDADSEGEEGKFFVWTPAEIRSILASEDVELFCRLYDVTDAGNYEHHNILHLAAEPGRLAEDAGLDPSLLEATLARCRQALFDARERRVKPGRDEKVLTAWNGMMARAFAEAAVAFDRSDWGLVAARNADFVLREMRRDGRLLRTWKQGEAKLNGYLEDYACMVDALIAVYEATFDPRWIAEARQVADTMLAHFADRAAGGFFDTSDDHETLVTRPKDVFDNATPAGNSVAADALQRLSLHAGEERYAEAAGGILRLLAPVAAQHPTGFGRTLCALDFYLSSPREIAIVGDLESVDTRALLRVVSARFLPNKIVAASAASNDELPLLAGRGRVDGRATAYVCRNYACELPVTGPADLERQLG
jgi:hypothetical protein